MDQQRLLNAAYTAPSTGDLQPLLHALCEITGQDRATYGVYCRADTLPSSFMSIGVDEDESDEFLSSHHLNNVWRQKRLESSSLNTKLFHASHNVSEYDKHETAWYQSFMPKHHIADGISICARQNRDSHAAITIVSTENQPAFDVETLHGINELYPHLSHALSVYTRVRGMALERQFFESANRSKQQAHILIDNFGRIVQCTEKALNILRSNDGLSVQRGYIVIADQIANQGFCSSVRMALNAPEGATVPPAVAIQRPSGETPYILDCCPWMLGESTDADKQAHVLLTLFSADEKTDLRDELIHTAFGLSCAETRVVRALVLGMSLKQIAEANHITVHTVRNHLKSVFAKTGFKRQGEMIGALINFIAE